MDFITSAILGGLLFETVKSGVTISASSIKNELREWIFPEGVAEAIAEIAEKLNDEEKSTEDKLVNALDDSAMFKVIAPLIKPNTNYSNTHYGTGDIVNGDKIINSKT